MTLQRGVENWESSPQGDFHDSDDEPLETNWDPAPEEIKFLCAAIEAFGPVGRNQKRLFKLLNSGVDETWFLSDNRKYIYLGLFDAALKINSPGVSVRIGAIVDQAEALSGAKGWALDEIKKITDRIGIIDIKEILEKDIPLWWHKLKKPKTLDILGRLNLLLAHLPPTFERLDKITDLIDEADRQWNADVNSTIADERLHEEVRKECLEPMPDDYNIETGLTCVDEMLNGGIGGHSSPDSGRLIVVCARPGAGKSLFATNVGLRTALRGHKVLMWSLEMGRKEIAMRNIATRDYFFCRRFGASEPITYNQLKRRSYTSIQRDRLDSVSYAGIDDNFSVLIGSVEMTAEYISTQMKLYARRDPETRLFIIDHLGLMALPPNRNQATAVGHVTRYLKVTARELGIDVMLLCQLNRGPEGREDKKPGLADLRDSGCIEQDADIVIGLYRPYYYSKNPVEENDLELISLKNRQGKSNYSLGASVYLDNCSIAESGNRDDIAPPAPSTAP